MDSIQIEKLLWANSWTHKQFLGCFAADQLPAKFEKFPCCLIINLDTRNNPGSHWVAAYIKNESKCYYFDSYGPLNCLNPSYIKPKPYCITGPNSNIYNFLNSFKSVTTNKSIYQSINSSKCGHYCIYFIYSMCIGISFSKIIHILDAQYDANYFVFYFVKNIYFFK